MDQSTKAPKARHLVVREKAHPALCGELAGGLEHLRRVLSIARELGLPSLDHGLSDFRGLRSGHCRVARVQGNPDVIARLDALEPARHALAHVDRVVAAGGAHPPELTISGTLCHAPLCCNLSGVLCSILCSKIGLWRDISRGHVTYFRVITVTWRNDWSGKLAERQGFEPWVGSHRQRFSRPPHSTTLPPLRVRGRRGTGI